MAENINPEKPVNPEMENVSVNQPEAPLPTPKKEAPKLASSIPSARPKSAIPTKLARETDQKKSNTKFLLGCAGGLFLLFVLFVVLMVFVMSRGGGDNAVIRAFGLAPGAIRAFLLNVINLAFGLLALLLFVLMVIGVFRWVGAKKGDVEKRKRGFRMMMASLFPFAFVLVIWVLLFNFIGRLEITAERVVAEITVISPVDLNNLQAPVEVTFSALRVKQALATSQLGVTSASWDLDGDGFFETPVSAAGEVTRLYENRGVFNVGLQVQVAGETAPRIYNFPLSIPEAVFGAEPSTGSAPLRVVFSAESLLPKAVKASSLDWDFDGDGKYELTGPDNESPIYTFEKLGTYKVHLRIIDEQDNVENYYRDIEVVPSGSPLLSARIEASPGLSGSVPLTVRFDGGSSSSSKGRITRYEWDFGDGSALQEGKSVSHAYTRAGTYRVTLFVTDDAGTQTRASVDVEAQTVTSAPTAKIRTLPASSDGELTGTLPFKVSFDASSSTDPDNDIVDYQWDFNGDGASDASGKKVDHTFDEAGDYSMTLTVKDSEEHSSTAPLSVHVAEPGVQAQISAEPTEGTLPLTVRFDGSGSSSFRGSIVSYEWDFGDGTPKSVTGATINHRYETVGNYTATLKVTSGEGESGTDTQIIVVREVPLTACIEASRTTGVAPLSVTFDSKCSTGAVAQYSWNFGDGETNTARKPAHTFQAPGTYTVVLEIRDSKNNVNSTSVTITVTGE
ncbi:MAG: PKD domain-containing protein [Candidatus Peregrinibacteria bacterium]